MPGVGFEPTGPLRAVDFKSTAYSQFRHPGEGPGSLWEPPEPRFQGLCTVDRTFISRN
jgi:hypothetical protein